MAERRVGIAKESIVIGTAMLLEFSRMPDRFGILRTYAPLSPEHPRYSTHRLPFSGIS